LGYKAQPPDSYKGDKDYDKFEQFVFDFDNWCIDTRQRDEGVVRLVSRFLKEKATRWYMANIVLNQCAYTMSKLYQELFEYCFPPYFKEELHKKHNKKKQNGSPVQDYFSELALLRCRLKEITDAQHAQRAWDRADKYIKYEWVLKGMRPDESTIEELKSAALDIECATGLKHAIERQEESRDHKRSKHHCWSQSPCKEHTHRTSDQHKENRENRSEGPKGRGWPEYQKNKDWRDTHPNTAHTSKQKDDYRAANKCFNCGEVRHLAKDCPSKNKAWPSKLGASATALKLEAKVRASSALLKELDKLTARKESIEVSSACICMSTTKVRGASTEPLQSPRLPRCVNHRRTRYDLGPSPLTR
jgi:hypothetical protein